MPLYPFVVIALPLAAHIGIVGGIATPAVVLLLGLFAAGAYAAWQRREHLLSAGYGLGAALVIAATATGAERHLFYAMPQVITGLLAGLFAASLASDRTPLVTRFATAVDGDLPADLRRYTRQVTRAWVVLFGLLHMEGWLLLVTATPTTWSLFANGLNYVFIGLFFALEFHVRRRRFPHWEQRSLTAFLAALVHTDLRRLMVG